MKIIPGVGLLRMNIFLIQPKYYLAAKPFNGCTA